MPYFNPQPEPDEAWNIDKNAKCIKWEMIHNSIISAQLPCQTIYREHFLGFYTDCTCQNVLVGTADFLLHSGADLQLLAVKLYCQDGIGDGE